MTDQSLSSDIFEQICKFGTHYNPASKHYNDIQNVVCDRCFRENLDICIGYEKYDLCFSCVQEIVRITNLKLQYPTGSIVDCPMGALMDYPKTRMAVGQFVTQKNTQSSMFNS